MAFPNSVIQQAWQGAGGKCECKRTTCGHVGKHNKALSQSSQGMNSDLGWEAHHITSVAAGGSDTLSNCEILCMACHKKTRTYGG